MFRGREVAHPELGRKILDHVAEEVVHLARVEVYPKLDGRNMTMMLAPDKKAQAAHAAALKQAEEEAATAATDTELPDAAESVAEPSEAEVAEVAVPVAEPSDAEVAEVAVPEAPEAPEAETVAADEAAATDRAPTDGATSA
jgi:translation initiation factor IF-3